MKFKIKYADQIVGTLTIIAGCVLVAAIFLIGSKQRWFARDYNYHTIFESATGLSVGMPIQYKGFTVGKVKKISLTKDDRVNMEFCIYDTYYNRARQGSLIQLFINPLGLGNQLQFFAGNGTRLIPEGSEIPRVDSEFGKQLIAEGKVFVPKTDDTITNLVAQIGPILTNVNDMITQLNGALSGKGSGPLTSSLNNISDITTTVNDSLAQLLNNVTDITDNLNQLSNSIKDPSGLVPTLIDPDGKMFGSIQNTLDSVNGTVKNLEASTHMLKTDMPQVAALLSQIETALGQAQDVLDGLRNNPLIKNGIQEHKKADTASGGLKDADF